MANTHNTDCCLNERMSAMSSSNVLFLPNTSSKVSYTASCVAPFMAASQHYFTLTLTIQVKGRSVKTDREARGRGEARTQVANKGEVADETAWRVGTLSSDHSPYTLARCTPNHFFRSHQVCSRVKPLSRRIDSIMSSVYL